MILRAEHARLNGHKSHFESVAGQRMMSAESAREFLKDASRISAPYLTELANKLCSLKQQDVESREPKFHENAAGGAVLGYLVLDLYQRDGKTLGGKLSRFSTASHLNPSFYHQYSRTTSNIGK